MSCGVKLETRLSDYTAIHEQTHASILQTFPLRIIEQRQSRHHNDAALKATSWLQNVPHTLSTGCNSAVRSAGTCLSNATSFVAGCAARVSVWAKQLSEPGKLAITWSLHKFSTNTCTHDSGKCRHFTDRQQVSSTSTSATTQSRMIKAPRSSTGSLTLLRSAS